MTQVFSRPEYGNWLNRRSPLAWLLERFLRFAAWLDQLSGTHPFLYYLLFWGAVALLVSLAVHIGYTAWLVYRRTTRPAAEEVAARRPPGTAESPARRAEALAREGRYAEALAWRFLALVQELEARRAVDARASKTPAEYVAEARLDPEGRATLAALVGRLYRHLFGAEPCDAAEYAAFAETARAVVGHVAPR